MGEKDYAVVVGISRYPALSDLSGPVNDALSFKDWLLNRGSVPLKNIELLVTPANAETMTRKNAQPLRDQVINAFDAIREHENERGRVGRRLYLYLAGHGYAPQVNDAALLMANASHRSFSAVPGAVFADWFHASAKFEEIVLIMDCCRDDCSAIPPQPPPWAPENSPDADQVRYFHAFATQTYHKAREQALTSDGMVRGIFTNALLTAFEMARDAHGRITGTAVKDYVMNYPMSIDGLGYQEPEIRIDSAKDIVLWEADTIRKQAVEFDFGSSCHGSARILDGRLENVWSGAIPANGVLSLELEPGKYRIDADGLSCGKRFDVMGNPEEVIHVNL